METPTHKQCRRCAQMLPLSNFARKTRACDGLQSYCRVCAHEMYAAHYAENKERIVARNHARNMRMRCVFRQMLLDHYAAHPCIDCGESDPIVLELDHVSGEKVGNVSDMIRRGWCSERKLREEFAKCETRCANCHRRKTALQFGWHRYMMGDDEGL